MKAEDALIVFDELVPGWRDWPRVGSEREGCVPWREDAHPSLHINAAKATWIDRATSEGGGAWDFAVRLRGEQGARSLLGSLRGPAVKPRGMRPVRSNAEPAAAVQILGSPTGAQVEALRTERRADGPKALQQLGVARVSAWGADWLAFPLFGGGWKAWGVDADGRIRRDERGLVRRNLGPVSIALSPELRTPRDAAPTVDRLFDLEGESDLLAAVIAGLRYVVASSGGAGSLAGHERAKSFLRELAPREVAVIGDLDDAGRAGAEKRARWWQALGFPVRSVSLPEVLGPKGDVRDFLLGKPGSAPLGGAAELDALADAAEQLAAEPTTAARSGERLSDLGNARRIVALHGHDLAYAHALGRWLVWDGLRWAEDQTGEVERRAKSTVRSILEEAASAEDLDKRKAIASHAIRSESARAIAAMISLARSEPGIAATVDELDVDPWSFNVVNGTLDLRRGQLRPHDRADRITKLAPVPFAPDATAPKWDAFLHRIMAGNRQMIAFLQRLAGYCLTGDTTEGVLPILWGDGANGKTTLIETLRFVLGDYAQQAPEQFLASRRPDVVPADIARLRGARFVSAVETEEGAPLAESLVKRLTGGDRITARFLYREFFEFRPVAKIVLATNHRPRVRGDSHAIWRRLRLIPFSVTIPEHERDLRLGEQLQREAPGILAWAVKGCALWLRDGLAPPPEVESATHAYRAENDPVSQFIADRCVKGTNLRVKAADLYAAYRTWSFEQGEDQSQTLRQNALGERLAARGFEPRPYGKARERHWFGIGLRDGRHGEGGEQGVL